MSLDKKPQKNSLITNPQAQTISLTMAVKAEHKKEVPDQDIVEDEDTSSDDESEVQEEEEDRRYGCLGFKPS